MAQIKLAYIGGGSSRGAGTMASLAEQGENFGGSEIVLIDLDAERLELVREVAERLMRARGLDITVTATTDRRAGLSDCDAVLTSYRPGGFEARVLDERIPLTYDVIGQETQGPGGFFMALRSIAAMKPMLEDVEYSCPGATIFNYTNPVNIVSQAVSDHSDIPIISFCEGPIETPRMLAEAVGLDPDKLDVASVGLNHGSWSVRHIYDDAPLLPRLREIWAKEVKHPTLTGKARRVLQLAATMGTIPSDYFEYYYFEREILEEYHAKPTTRAEDILAELPSYWSHYAEQAKSDAPVLDPARSRGGIHELELALDCMDAVFNDRNEIMTVNVANEGTLEALPDTLVIETLGQCDASGVTPIPMPGLPTHVLGLVESLAYYQQAAADAAWDGGVLEATRALASHPLVRSMDVAERMYAEMAIAHRDHLPDRLVPS
jgi:6-phospho-beta-glucosidase